MAYFFTVSPDFTPDKISSWYIFNTWLQRAIDENIHLELFDDFDSQREVIDKDGVDLIFANPYDAAALIREKGFRAVARPKGKGDEALIAVSHNHSAQRVEDLAEGLRVASTDDPDVHMMGYIMLEPAELDSSNTTRTLCDTYPLVAKQLIRHEADAGFFLVDAFDGLSGITRKQLRPLVRSQINVIYHALMVGPRFAHRCNDIQRCLIDMENDKKGLGVLSSLGFESWEVVKNEEAEFMIDLMETLAWQP